jgi:hypothetical protein
LRNCLRSIPFDLAVASPALAESGSSATIAIGAVSVLIGP